MSSSSSSQLPSPPAPDAPGNGESSQPTFPKVTVTHPSVREPKEKKKRVGFAGDPSPPREEDYFSQVVGTDSRNTTPGLPDAGGPAQRRDSFDKAELTEALVKILKPEDHSGPGATADMVASNLRLPKPALRKNLVPDSAAEPVEGLSHPSEIEARHRAGRLAEDVSGLVSRASLTDDESQHGLLDTVQVQDYAATTSVSPGDAASEGLTYRKKAENEAERLVRRHTMRQGRSPETPITPQMPGSGNHSGTATPVAYDLEFVPPAPTQYRGGILGTLLKLYGAEADKHGDGSGSNTPMSRTPNRTPNRTPRSSPPTTAPGTPHTYDPPSRPRSGLFGLGSRNSSSTLAELIGSSSTLAAPANATNANKDWADAVSSKLKNDRSDKKKKEHKRKTSNQQKIDAILVKKHIAEIMSRHRYLVKLCRALMEYGAPTHRLEAYMAMSSRVLAIQGQFLYLPGTMIISFDDPQTHTTEVKIVRAPQGVDLGKLRDVHEIYKLVVHDLISVDDAMCRLDNVVNKKPKFNRPTRVVLYGLAAVTVGPFAFNARWIDMPIAFVMGCILGVMQLYAAASSDLYANVFEISASLLMSFLGRLFGSIEYQGERLFCFSALAQSSIALILPGYMVLCGSLELQSHNMIAGSVRMVYAMIYTLFLGYGVTIGAVLYGLMDKNAVSSTTCSEPLNSYWNLLFVPLFTMCLCTINQAKWKQMPVMLLIAFTGYVVSSQVDQVSDSSIVSSTLGALSIGVLANIYSRISRHTENFFLDLWDKTIQPRLKGIRNQNPDDPELDLKSKDDGPSAPDANPTGRRVGYGLAAAAMLPAIFVQVPSGLASGGSLVAGVNSANAITGNKTAESSSGDISSSAFTVLESVIQVAISISVGLSLAALIVYPFGKRRSGLFSF